MSASQHSLLPQDDDDDDICPVCDGQCTCNTNNPPPPPRPPLKIRLTVPKRRGRPRKAPAPAPRPRAASTDSSDADRPFAQFPTFVSASVLSSRASSSDAESSGLDSFDSDSSIEAEEENFIVSEMQGRARVRRELFGDDVPKKRDPHNAWVIRPRKKSVGPSDAEMDVDSDATEDAAAADDDDDDDAEQDEEETDERAPSVAYVGLATGWTEDEDESSFDADLFFANLSDSDAHTSSVHGDDADHSDVDSIVASVTSPPSLEVQERWDGQIVFTNGLCEGQGMLDVDFEAHAASFAESSPSPGPASDPDIDMSDVDDGGYEEDADERDDGETTDEELVGHDDLPNERAMRLFMTPFSVSAIDPLSTMSPAVSPRPRPRPRPIDSPKPADILSGRVFWDSDDYEDPAPSAAHASPGPRRGHFVPSSDVRQAIIDDRHQDIPSPHPRFRRRRPSLVHLKTVSVRRHPGDEADADHTQVEAILQRHLAAPHPPAGAKPGAAHADAELVDLDDVLEPSILDPEPPDADARKEPAAFSRWDVVSVGAFRQSRERAEGAPKGRPGDYGGMMKAGPLSTMLWHHKRERRTGVVISPVLLPVRERERERDGDRTPTNGNGNGNGGGHHHHQNQRNDGHPHKTRKELRRERKLKRKSYAAVNYAGQRHAHHHQHQHQHHPNMKSRSTASAQRGWCGASAVPPLNI
ncbi:hypothetical protein C0993_009761 [Termitomyces sp. T159_Od127]|nr:hypothetical protein C0993_009761 [Termitomyces sp. T159_Od127]